MHSIQSWSSMTIVVSNTKWKKNFIGAWRRHLFHSFTFTSCCIFFFSPSCFFTLTIVVVCRSIIIIINHTFVISILHSSLSPTGYLCCYCEPFAIISSLLLVVYDVCFNFVFKFFFLFCFQYIIIIYSFIHRHTNQSVGRLMLVS